MITLEEYHKAQDYRMYEFPTGKLIMGKKINDTIYMLNEDKVPVALNLVPVKEVNEHLSMAIHRHYINNILTKNNITKI